MYRRSTKKWDSTQDLHRFITLVGLLAQVGSGGVYCTGACDTDETRAWPFIAFNFMVLLAAFIVNFALSLRPR